ncbi:hypothetical protein PGT21_022643 [Puccinia graminis f. sp. tritici]|uniref:Uncharacterized protein n=1 Tax=Puccinia graminis f. sp. tritici TaxID=56615 RepID=A0A5B0M6V7_PUCGR|nr:hypothetical protein PGTUg99_014771 [Puccinia graminis f. sp. tritici]KAA1071913.1 hypothetical protein PGT21_022643 [Puccinia graminis f. sp. tritici]
MKSRSDLKMECGLANCEKTSDEEVRIPESAYNIFTLPPAPRIASFGYIPDSAPGTCRELDTAVEGRDRRVMAPNQERCVMDVLHRESGWRRKASSDFQSMVMCF